MSILDFPRLNFRGVFKTNPCTANNDDVIPSVVTRDTNALGKHVSTMNDNEASEFLTQSVEMQNYDQPTGVKQFTRTGWNPYGDHATSFEDTSIMSVAYSADKSTTLIDQDPIVGIKLEIIGSASTDDSQNSTPVIVDLDPTGLVSTQIFIGGIKLSFHDDEGKKRQVDIIHNTRAYQNWLNFCSTVGDYEGEQNFVGIACVWQCTIPSSCLPQYESFGLHSLGLEKLLSEARKKGGLAIRFRTYEVEPGYSDIYLNKHIQQGNLLPNPAYGYLIGTIGVWADDEPQTEPAGRKLEATYRLISPELPILPDSDLGRPAMCWAAKPTSSAVTTVPGCPYPWMGPPALIGNVVVKVRQDPAIISLDIIETFPKLGFRNPKGSTDKNPPEGFDQAKHMAYVGDIELAVIPAGKTEGDALSIVDIDYGFNNFSSYEDWGGIIDLHYNPKLYQTIKQGQLILRGKSTPSGSDINAGITLVKETIIRVVTDDRTAYLPFDDQDYPLSLKVYERGGATTRDITIFFYEYKTIIQLKPKKEERCDQAENNQYRTNQSVSIRTKTTPIDGATSPPICPPNDNLKEPSRLLFQKNLVVAKGTLDWVHITVRANLKAKGGAAILAFQTEQDYIYGTIPSHDSFSMSPAGVPMWSNAAYSSIRVYEKEDFSALYQHPDGLQWQDVYKYALRYYFLIFPAMSAIMPLNSPSSICDANNARLISQRLHTPDQANFYTTLNMPVTRTLSPPRIKLILDFIAQKTKKRG